MCNILDNDNDVWLAAVRSDFKIPRYDEQQGGAMILIFIRYSKINVPTLHTEARFVPDSHGACARQKQTLWGEWNVPSRGEISP